MNILNYLKDNTLFIIPNNQKNKLLTIINDNKKLMNIKILTLEEIKKKLLFNYDEKTINFLINKYDLSYSNAQDLISNLYYLPEHLFNQKLIHLSNIKKELEENELLYFDNYFSDSLKNKQVYVYGFDYLYKFDLFLLDKIKKLTNLEIISQSTDNFSHLVLKFKNINEEIEFVANDILEKINSGIDINKIFLTNVHEDYLSTIKRIFIFYNIPINLNEKISLYNLPISYKLLNHLDKHEEIIGEISDKKIKDLCINIFNKYYWADNLLLVKNMLEYEFKNANINNNLRTNAVNTSELKNSFINEDDYIYLIGFNKDYIPYIHKDETLINDKEKPEFLEQSWELNNIESNIWNKIINKNKNLIITFAEMNLKKNLEISPLHNNLQVIEKKYKVSSFSHQSNNFNLGILLDEFLKFGNISLELNRLKFNYPQTNYLQYNNDYRPISSKLIKDFFSNKISLSFTKMNTYYECSFRYYLDYILKLNSYEESFEAYLGSLCHYILSKIYDNNFNFENTKQEYITNHLFNLSEENIIFMNKVCEELKFTVEHIKSHLKHSLFKEIECEKNIIIKQNKDIQIEFNGIIDKILKFENKLAIIDYKSYNPDTDLSLIHHGLKMQLPIYIYLIKNLYPDSKIVGIYLQHITQNIPMFNPKKSISEIKKDSLKLNGFTTNIESIIKELDDTYENSEFIKGLSMTANGFSHYAKLLTDLQFENLYTVAEESLNKCIQNILEGKFDINPKILNQNNISCSYCKYKSVCFVNEHNYNYISSDKDLKILGGNNNA